MEEAGIVFALRSSTPSTRRRMQRCLQRCVLSVTIGGRRRTACWVAGSLAFRQDKTAAFQTPAQVRPSRQPALPWMFQTTASRFPTLDPNDTINPRSDPRRRQNERSNAMGM